MLNVRAPPTHDMCALVGWLQMEGVSGFCDASTMGPGDSNAPASIASGLQHQQQHNYSNAAGHMEQDEEIFASSEVHTVGQVQSHLPHTSYLSPCSDGAG